MKTLIEIFDESPISNVYAAAALKPERVVFIGGRRMTRESCRERISSFFKSIGLEIETEYYLVNPADFEVLLHRLRRIIKKHPDCVVDLAGGSETVIAAFGMLSGELNIPMFSINPRTKAFVNVRNIPDLDGLRPDISFTVEQVVAMAGGLVTGHGHISDKSITPEIESDVLKVWKTVKRFRKQWPEQTLFFQRANKHRADDELHSDNLTVEAIPINRKALGTGSRCSMGIIRALAADGILTDIKDRNGMLSFRYKNTLMKKCLSDAGIWLEMYGFITARNMDIFSDAQLSVTVDWNGDVTERFNTYNELDIMLTSGITPVFISCKMSAPSVAAINEIKTLAQRFGGKYARAVILTMADMSKDAPFALQRAYDSGVRIIDRNMLSTGKLGDCLANIVK